jgi:uncharacterized protein YpmS
MQLFKNFKHSFFTFLAILFTLAAFTLLKVFENEKVGTFDFKEFATNDSHQFDNCYRSIQQQNYSSDLPILASESFSGAVGGSEINFPTMVRTASIANRGSANQMTESHSSEVNNSTYQYNGSVTKPNIASGNQAVSTQMNNFQTNNAGYQSSNTIQSIGIFEKDKQANSNSFLANNTLSLTTDI